jgi:Tfp pilus assembly protein PilN
MEYMGKRKKHDRYILAGITLVLSLSFIYGVILLIRGVYEKELAAVQVEKKLVESKIGALSEYEKTLRSISEYETITKEVNMQVPVWEDVLAEISSILPHGVWFDRVDLRYESNRGVCEIAGRATEKDMIVSWIRDLEESRSFKNVELKHIGENEEEGKKTTMFIVGMEVVPGEG